MADIRPVAPAQLGAEESTAGRTFPEGGNNTCSREGDSAKDKCRRSKIDACNSAEQKKEQKKRAKDSRKAKGIKLISFDHLSLMNLPIMATLIFFASTRGEGGTLMSSY